MAENQTNSQVDSSETTPQTEDKRTMPEGSSKASREEKHQLRNEQNVDQLQAYLKMMMEKKGISPEDLRN